MSDVSKVFGPVMPHTYGVPKPGGSALHTFSGKEIVGMTPREAAQRLVDTYSKDNDDAVVFADGENFRLGTIHAGIFGVADRQGNGDGKATVAEVAQTLSEGRTYADGETAISPHIAQAVAFRYDELKQVTKRVDEHRVILG